MLAHALITTLTPVHIGSGVKYKHNVEFFSEGNYIYIIDPEKVYVLIGQKGIDDWVKAINNNIPIKDFLKNRKFDYDSITYKKCELVNEIKKDKELHEQIFNPLLGPYIPGSSIKGAIKTSIIDYISNNSEKIKEIVLNDIRIENEDKNNRKPKINWKDNEVDIKLFGADENHKSTRFIKVGDAYYSNTLTKIYFSQALNAENDADNGMWKLNGAISNLYEAIPENSKALFQFSIDERLLELNIQYEPDKWSKIDTSFLNSKIVSIIRDSTKNAIQREIAFFKENKLDHAGNELIKHYELLLQEFSKLKDNEFIIRVGANSGYNFMTLRWIDNLIFFKPIIRNQNYKELREQIQVKFDKRTKRIISPDYREKNWPRTRKIVTTGIPFGFVKITLLSDQEYESYKNQIIQQQTEPQKPAIQPAPEETQVKNPEPIAPKIPAPYKAPLKQGTGRIPAQVIKSGKPNVVKLLIENNESELKLAGYASELPEGKYIYVKITGFSKGKILQVNYESDFK